MKVNFIRDIVVCLLMLNVCFVYGQQRLKKSLHPHPLVETVITNADAPHSIRYKLSKETDDLEKVTPENLFTIYKELFPIQLGKHDSLVFKRKNNRIDKKQYAYEQYHKGFLVYRTGVNLYEKDNQLIEAHIFTKLITGIELDKLISDEEAVSVIKKGLNDYFTVSDNILKEKYMVFDTIEKYISKLPPKFESYSVIYQLGAYEIETVRFFQITLDALTGEIIYIKQTGHH